MCNVSYKSYTAVLVDLFLLMKTVCIEVNSMFTTLKKCSVALEYAA